MALDSLLLGLILVIVCVGFCCCCYVSYICNCNTLSKKYFGVSDSPSSGGKGIISSAGGLIGGVLGYFSKSKGGDSIEDEIGDDGHLKTCDGNCDDCEDPKDRKLNRKKRKADRRRSNIAGSEMPIVVTEKADGSKANFNIILPKPFTSKDSDVKSIDKESDEKLKSKEDSTAKLGNSKPDDSASSEKTSDSDPDLSTTSPEEPRRKPKCRQKEAKDEFVGFSLPSLPNLSKLLPIASPKKVDDDKDEADKEDAMKDKPEKHKDKKNKSNSKGPGYYDKAKGLASKLWKWAGEYPPPDYYN